MQRMRVLNGVALLGALLAPATALASAPAGVWVKVREVVYAPDAVNPTHVQVHGALMLYDGNDEAVRPYGGYTSPALGYMYYRCPDGHAETCREEWRDLEANIAKPDSECLGFGMMSLPTGTLRAPGTAADSPDIYPLQSGVSPGHTPCLAIAQYLAGQAADGAGGAGGAGDAGGAGGTGGAASTGGTDASQGGVPASRAGAGSSEKPAEPGSSGSPSLGSARGGTTAGRTSSAAGDVGDPEELAKDGATDDQVSACSISEATGAASLFGFGAVLGIFVLGLVRRNRPRK